MIIKKKTTGYSQFYVNGMESTTDGFWVDHAEINRYHVWGKLIITLLYPYPLP